MADRIEVRALRVLGVHGALAHEKAAPQPFELDIDVETDFSDAIEHDELVDAVDYAQLIADARHVVESTSFSLLESLASAIADVLLRDERISAVTIELRKLRPPVDADVATTGVVLTRSHRRVGSAS